MPFVIHATLTTFTKSGERTTQIPTFTVNACSAENAITIAKEIININKSQELNVSAYPI